MLEGATEWNTVIGEATLERLEKRSIFLQATVDTVLEEYTYLKRGCLIQITQVSFEMR